MKTRIQKWGNSLALRIPKSFAAEAHLLQDSEVDLSLVEGRLVVEASPKATWTLEQLLKQVTEENKHGEMPTGDAVGAEAW